MIFDEHRHADDAYHDWIDAQSVDLQSLRAAGFERLARGQAEA